LLDDVDADALRALDAYEDEGRLYRRLAVSVSVDGRPTGCHAYVSPTSPVA
jgi:Gamma-glutamyl cyclotransferase, AIG2-like